MNEAIIETRGVSSRSEHEAAIEISGLVKRYSEVTAVDHLSFCVRVGETFGLLGPNGAGKTTTVECIEGIRRPDAGTIRVLGFDPITNPAAVKARIGVQLQTTSLPPLITPREALQLFATFYPRHREPDELLDWAGLSAHADRPYDSLSGGQQQRLALALALINDPALVILDEPTAGLDAHARHELHELIGRFRREGRTVLLTTHYIEEAERLCDRVAIMNHGRLIACDKPQRLIEAVGAQHTVEITLTGPSELSVPPVPARCRVVDCTRPGPNELHLTLLTDSLPESLPALISSLAPDYTISSLHVRNATLEEAFLKLTAKQEAESSRSASPTVQSCQHADR